MMKLESQENNGEEAIVYPRKVLALYKDSEGTLKLLIHPDYQNVTTTKRYHSADMCLPAITRP
jgi:hypothetical protein